MLLASAPGRCCASYCFRARSAETIGGKRTKAVDKHSSLQGGVVIKAAFCLHWAREPYYGISYLVGWKRERENL